MGLVGARILAAARAPHRGASTDAARIRGRSGVRMGKMRVRQVLTLLAFVAVLALHADSRAQSSGGPYAIPTQTVPAGGGRSTGGAFTLDGTIAQHAIGPASTGGGFELVPGFRRRLGPVVDGVFADGFEDP